MPRKIKAHQILHIREVKDIKGERWKRKAAKRKNKQGTMSKQCFLEILGKMCF